MADGTLRVLALGGLGEIGKNMTVFELDGRIVVVDVGLRFPTAEMVGIDLVLPDFSYLRSRVDDIEGIIVTHGDNSQGILAQSIGGGGGDGGSTSGFSSSRWATAINRPRRCARPRGRRTGCAAPPARGW